MDDGRVPGTILSTWNQINWAALKYGIDQFNCQDNKILKCQNQLYVSKSMFDYISGSPSELNGEIPT